MQQASVAELPFEAEQFDVVTAFETIYFWPELAQNFREVYRVLKPGGTFFICNSATLACCTAHRPAAMALALTFRAFSTMTAE